jgi:predicted nucleic acid-binding protein
MATRVSSYFRFRPFLEDPKDDLFVECAFAAGARIIVTDDRHFRYSALLDFGIRALSAKQFVLEMKSGGGP